jgi:hypothetical protein
VEGLARHKASLDERLTVISFSKKQGCEMVAFPPGRSGWANPVMALKMNLNLSPMLHFIRCKAFDDALKMLNERNALMNCCSK